MAAPVLAVSYGIKSYAFSWTAVPGATAYQLLEDPDGPGPLLAVQVGGDITGTSTSVPVFLPERVNASYQLRACTSGGALSAALQPDPVRAVGYFKASNAEAQDDFGSTVALSADGNTLAVGAPSEDSAATGVDGDQADNSAPRTGAVYVFARVNGAWAQQAYLKAGNAEAFDRFGISLALSADGNTLAVGALDEDSAASGINGDPTDSCASNAGAVYVFTRSGAVWSQQAYVKAGNTGIGDQFGISVALSPDGNTLAVGAPEEGSGATGVGGDQADNSAAFSGAVYVYTRSGAAWAQQAYVKASRAQVNAIFGYSVALSTDGSTLAVGASLDSSAGSGVGASQPGAGAEDSGAVYMLRRSGTAWAQQAYVKPTNTRPFMYFGDRLALSGDGRMLAVGAGSESSGATGIGGNQADTSATSAGAVYLY